MSFIEKILRSGLYLLALILPFQTRLFIRPGIVNGGYFEYGTISLYVTDILIIFLVILFIFNRLRKNNKILLTKISYFIFGLNFTALLTVLLADDKFLTLYHYLRLTFGMAIFFLLINVAYERARFFYFLLAGAFIQALFAIWQFLTQMTFANKWFGLAVHQAGLGGASVIETLDGERWLRAYGGLDHPNILGGYLAICLLLVFIMMIRPDQQEKHIADYYAHNNSLINRFKKFLSGQIFQYLILFVFLMALFFTFNRGAWLAIIAVYLIILAILIYMKHFYIFKKLIALSVLPIILFGILIFSYKDLVFTRLSGSARLEIKSNQERLASYSDGISVIKKNWLIGTGIGAYPNHLASIYPDKASWYYQPIHNVFLLVFAELGIIGFIFFVALIIFAAKTCYAALVVSTAKTAELESILIKLSLLFCLILLMLVDHYMWSLHFGILFFWLVLGLVVRPETGET